MEVSWNRGTSKLDPLIDGFSIQNHPFGSTPYFRKPLWSYTHYHQPQLSYELSQQTGAPSSALVVSGWPWRELCHVIWRPGKAQRQDAHLAPRVSVGLRDTAALSNKEWWILSTEVEIATETVSFHNNNGGSVHSYVNVYQTVCMCISMRWLGNCK